MTFSHTALTDTAKRQVRRSQMQYRIVDTAASVRKSLFHFPQSLLVPGEEIGGQRVGVVLHDLDGAFQTIKGKHR